MMKYLILLFTMTLNFVVFSQKKSTKIGKSDLINKVKLKGEEINGNVRIFNNNNQQKKVKPVDTIPNESKPEKQAQKQPALSFDEFKSGFIESLWQLNPNWASEVGYHKFDAVLEIPYDKKRTTKLKTYKLVKAQLANYVVDELSPTNQTDYALIKNFLESEIWKLTEFHAFEWNPSVYNLGSTFNAVLQNKDDNDETILHYLSKKLSFVPLYYDVAKKNLKNATINHTELAIKQIPGSLTVFEEEILKKINDSEVEMSKKSAVLKNLKAAIGAIKDFGTWLEDDYLPQLKASGNARSFRLGKALYARKFQLDINSDFTAEAIYQRALEEKESTLQKMKEIAKELWSTYFPGEALPKDNFIAPLIQKISEDHVERDDFIPSIKQQIPELKAFVEANDLVYLDPDKPLEIRETPKYMAGIAGASISAPGPYEKDGETYYNVTPLTKYNDEEAESYLREYNNYMLQILNIHEAIPGHYTQLVEANKVPGLVKSIFGNGTMIEGWACYAERMMLEAGYGNHQPELWLMYYKWLLRIISNTILDYSLHNLNMSEEDALHLLVNDAFQEETEAKEKIKRAKLTQVQLCSYYTGLTEILDLRNDYLKDDTKSLRSFHDIFLSFGSAPVKEIRKLMLLD